MNTAGSERRLVVVAIFIVVSLVYIIRLFYIQVIDESYLRSATNNALRYNTEYPSRGLIYDRNGKLLLYNEAVYDLMIVPRQVKELDTAEFCEIIGITREDFRKKFKKAKNYSNYKESVFEKQLSAETFSKFQEKIYKFPGFHTQVRTVRKYPQATAAHVLGYIGEVDEKTAAKNPYYRSGDYIGISGIERSYENELRGQRGVKIIMVDVHNRPMGSYENGEFDTLAVSGKDVVCTLDGALQAYGEKLMENKVGSIAAIEPSSGEILALVTSPAYDPNLLVGRKRTKNYSKLLVDSLKPLFNRALQAYYPPGSTFKLINALIGLKEGTLRHSSVYPCRYFIGSKPVHCHPHPAPADLFHAIQYSCNPYFCHTFRAIIDNNRYKSTEQAYEKWRNYVLSFGIGRKLNSDLPYELPGLVPTVKYYDRYFGKGRWKSSTIVSLAIGQGELGITPLQMANIMATIGNRGYFYIPHIIRYVGSEKTKKTEFSTPNYTLIEARYFESIIEPLIAVVEHGTAAGSKIKGIPFCGKTGTAQNPHGKDHSLFYAFAPAVNPKIAIAVVVENAGFGATWAAPIASLMIEKYLTDSISRPQIEQRILETKLLGNKVTKKDSTEISVPD